MNRINNSNYQKALDRITELYRTVNRNSDLFTSKDKVLSEYQNLFSISSIKNLEENEFKEFLNFKSNHHWTSLQRQGKNLTNDMETLKKALTELLDGSELIGDRIDDMTAANGLGPGIYTPILMITSNLKYAVWNGPSEGFLNKYGIKPHNDSKGSKQGKYYEKLNEIFNRLADSAKIDLWTLDALFHYDLHIDEIETEIQRRKNLWGSLTRNPDGKVLLSELSLAHLRNGRERILSHKLRPLEETATLAISATSRNDASEESSLTFDFDPAYKHQDENEYGAMFSAMHYKVPIFVLIDDKKDKHSRTVKIGMIRDLNTNLRSFFVELFDHWPVGEAPYSETIKEEEEEIFSLTDEDKNEKRAETKIRPEQARFKFEVTKRYGAECAVCGVNLKEILEAAHIFPKSERGPDQAINGLILCANHHKMFDSNLFTIGVDFKLVYKKGYNKDDLLIKEEDLSRLPKKPHIKAIEQRYDMFKKEA